MIPKKADVVIIGAGPAGAAMASLLIQQGIYPLVLERQKFPRFMIGESLLPEALNCLSQAGLLEVVTNGGHQFKDGARFSCQEKQCDFQFSDKVSQGINYAYQVKRQHFDHDLINHCIGQGANTVFETQVTSLKKNERGYQLQVQYGDEMHHVDAGFVVDASGFGRVLARLLKLDKPSSFPPKKAIFSHLSDNISAHLFDRNKISISQTQPLDSTWYWAIPFSDSTVSVGAVMDLPSNNEGKNNSNSRDGSLDEKEYFDLIERNHYLSTLLQGAELIRPVSCLSGYSSSIKKLYGDRFVILGNAGEFIDPIFSSGVTIALKSAVMAAPLVTSVIKGEAANWEDDFQLPLIRGINAFKVYVES